MKKILQSCSNSTFPPNIDRIIIQEATDYIFNQSILRSSLALILFLFLL
jgi:hypothetical protein